MFWLMALIASAGFAITFRTPRRYYLVTVSLGLGAIAFKHYLVGHVHVGMATFISAFAIGAASHLLARFTGKPAQAFLIPGVITLVPGTHIYRGFDQALAANYRGTAELFLVALTITLAICFGLLVATWIVPPKRAL